MKSAYLVKHTFYDTTSILGFYSHLDLAKQAGDNYYDKYPPSESDKRIWIQDDQTSWHCLDIEINLLNLNEEVDI